MAFTEFYCTNLGSNLNAGGLSNGAEPGPNAVYSSTNGNWSTTTLNFKPTDGTNPSTNITVGDFASIYIDGAAVGVYISRITAVQNAANGNITVSSTAKMGVAPVTSGTARSIKVGGAWLGPNAAVGFPLSLATVGAAVNSNSAQVRVNLKNASPYSISSGITSSGLSTATVQGYSSSPGDGGKATISGGTNAITLWTENSGAANLVDLILASSASSGAGSNLLLAGNASRLIRVLAYGARNVGLGVNSGSHVTFVECESYGNNTGNNANSGGIWISEGGHAKLVRCYSHDNIGSNSNGFYVAAANGIIFKDCIAESNGAVGFNIAATNGGGYLILNCDAYNNTSDGIKIGDFVVPCLFWIENCNLIKNGGKGINNAATSSKFIQGYVYNCGYGSGTQVNVGGDATLVGLIESGKVTYASDATPWVAATTGNFTINLAAAKNAGRAHWEENDGTNTGTAGYPDIGAAQHYDTQKASTFGG